jgi:hypothetical protein
MRSLWSIFNFLNASFLSLGILSPSGLAMVVCFKKKKNSEEQKLNECYKYKAM